VLQTFELPALRDGGEWRTSKPKEANMVNAIGKYALAIAAFCAVGSESFGSNVQAAESTANIPSITVRYGDLNLNTAGGVEALYARLRAAARGVCSPHAGRALVNELERRSCYEQVLSIAVSNVKSDSLSALHRVSSTRERLS
jgi:UrcA family protein